MLLIILTMPPFYVGSPVSHDTEHIMHNTKALEPVKSGKQQLSMLVAPVVSLPQQRVKNHMDRYSCMPKCPGPAVISAIPNSILLTAEFMCLYVPSQYLPIHLEVTLWDMDGVR